MKKIFFFLILLLFLNNALALTDLTPSGDPANKGSVEYNSNLVQIQANISQLNSKLDLLDQKTLDKKALTDFKTEMDKSIQANNSLVIQNILILLLVYLIFFYTIFFLFKSKGWL